MKRDADRDVFRVRVPYRLVRWPHKYWFRGACFLRRKADNHVLAWDDIDATSAWITTPN